MPLIFKFKKKRQVYLRYSRGRDRDQCTCSSSQRRKANHVVKTKHPDGSMVFASRIKKERKTGIQTIERCPRPFFRRRSGQHRVSGDRRGLWPCSLSERRGGIHTE